MCSPYFDTETGSSRNKQSDEVAEVLVARVFGIEGTSSSGMFTHGETSLFWENVDS